MMKAAHDWKLKAIVVYRLDRISRNISDFSALIEELSRLDIAFISIREQFDTATSMEEKFQRFLQFGGMPILREYRFNENRSNQALEKNYIVDIGLRNMLLGYRDADRGHILENVVSLESLRRDYRVYIGKVGDTMDRSYITSYDGIKSLNPVDRLQA